MIIMITRIITLYDLLIEEIEVLKSSAPDKVSSEPVTVFIEELLFHPKTGVRLSHTTTV